MDHSKATQWKISIFVSIFLKQNMILFRIILRYDFSRTDRRNEGEALYKSKSKKKKHIKEKEKRYYKHTKKTCPFLFPLHITSAPNSHTDKSVFLTTILQTDDSFSSFTFDAFPFYLPRPISTYVQKAFTKTGSYKYLRVIRVF